MKKISLWAKQNKNIARVLVVAIKVTLAFLAYNTGSKLYQNQLHIPVMWLGITAVISMCAVVLYPSKKLNTVTKHQLYVRQKSCDFILIACTFFIITTIVNNQDIIKPSLLSGSIASTIKREPPKAEDILASLSYRDKSSLTRAEKRVLKKEFFKQVKTYAIAKVTRDKDKADNALGIILTIIVAIGLGILLAAIVCSLSCNGAETAAGIVAVVGIIGIIWGSIVVIKHITKKRPNIDSAD